jgi:hypothetical protein
LEQFIAAMPKFHLFTTDFDSTISNGGISFTTRISNVSWPTANDLTQGWADTGASSSAITGTLKIRDFDVIFNELQWPTITKEVLLNTYLKPMAGQLANSITVDALSNVTSSVFTNTITPNSSSLFTVTGSSNSVQALSQTLDNLEIPFQDRWLIVTPNIYTSLVSGILPTYIYGQSSAVQGNIMPNLLGFDTVRYPRLYGAPLPQGGNKYGGGDKLVGLGGHKNGLVAAVRAPMEWNTGTVQSYTAVDATSGLSLQVRIIQDQSQPGIRLAVVSIFGTAAGNTNAIVPIITQSV